MLLFWTRHLAVDIEEFDEDHKRLIRILNELEFALQTRPDGKVDPIEIELAMRRLENAVEHHCADEEKLLEATEYPAYEQHKLEHEHFRALLADVKPRLVQSAEVAQALDFVGLIYNWITNHVYITDKQYTQFLLERPGECASHFASRKPAFSPRWRSESAIDRTDLQNGSADTSSVEETGAELLALCAGSSSIHSAKLVP